MSWYGRLRRWEGSRLWCGTLRLSRLVRRLRRSLGRPRRPVWGAVLMFVFVLVTGQMLATQAVRRELLDRRDAAREAAVTAAVAVELELEGLLDATGSLATAFEEARGAYAADQALLARLAPGHLPGGGGALLLDGDGHVMAFVGPPPRAARLRPLAGTATGRPRLAGPASPTIGGRSIAGVLDLEIPGGATLMVTLPIDSLAVRWSALVAEAGEMEFELERVEGESRTPVFTALTRAAGRDGAHSRVPLRAGGVGFEVSVAPAAGWSDRPLGGSARILAFALACLVSLLTFEILHSRTVAFAAVKRARRRLLQANHHLLEEGELRARAEERLAERAVVDAVTGLPTRDIFVRSVQRSIAGVSRSSGEGTPILCLGLDRFGDLAGTLGPQAADEVFGLVARRLFEIVQPSDVVARLPGARFGVLLPGRDGVEAAVAVWRRICTRFQEPIRVNGQDAAVTLSAGMTLISTGHEEPGEVINEAEIALHNAQSSGRGKIVSFDEELRDKTAGSIQLAGDLRGALERGELYLMYQPIVSIDERRIIGAEVLVRWRHPIEGNVSPGVFIPLAEEDGFIIPLSRWIREEACRELAGWRTSGLVADDFYLSVNMSPRELEDPGYVASVEALVEETGLPAGSIAFEVTERLLAHDTERTAELLERLREAGVHLLLDDFGTGYSSLAYLYKFRFDGIKIDRSFIVGVDTSPWHRTVVEAIVDLATKLGMKTIGEGIETESVAETLAELGCHLAQGYLFHRPLDLAELETALEASIVALHRHDGYDRRSADEPARERTVPK